MTITLTKRHLLLGLTAFVVVAAVVLWIARQALTGLAVNGLLNLAGATDISFTVTKATPWQVHVEDIRFKVQGQSIGAKRVSMVRPHWWTPSLGAVRVEQATFPLALDHLPKPVAPAQAPAPAKSGPSRLPLEEFSLDGKLVISADDLPGQPLAVTLVARVNDKNIASAQVQIDGPGVAARGDVDYNLTSRELTFRARSITVDVKTWQGFVQQQAGLTTADWMAEGQLAASAEGKWADDKFAGTARVQLREGQVTNSVKAITVAGITGDLEITDLAHFATKPATLRATGLKAGQLQLQNLDFEFHFESSNEVAITKATFQALGGHVSAEPFRYRFDRPELDAVVAVEGISVEEVMALTPDLPAKATGRVNGRFPLRLNADGLALGTGWMQLAPGAYAEIQFNAEGLLTGGASPSSPSYTVLKKVESGLLKLKVKELRLDIRPPNAPEGRSAQLHVAGEPVDPQVKAPVVLDLNVNGPLEKLLNLGLDSRVSFGAKP